MIRHIIVMILITHGAGVHRLFEQACYVSIAKVYGVIIRAVASLSVPCNTTFMVPTTYGDRNFGEIPSMPYFRSEIGTSLCSTFGHSFFRCVFAEFRTTMLTLSKQRYVFE